MQKAFPEMNTNYYPLLTTLLEIEGFLKKKTNTKLLIYLFTRSPPKLGAC
jgi:hypothetical protein